jgi:hypothetical protein
VTTLSVVIPALNEEDSIEQVMAQVPLSEGLERTVASFRGEPIA